MMGKAIEMNNDLTIDNKWRKIAKQISLAKTFFPL